MAEPSQRNYPYEEEKVVEEEKVRSRDRLEEQKRRAVAAADAFKAYNDQALASANALRDYLVSRMDIQGVTLLREFAVNVHATLNKGLEITNLLAQVALAEHEEARRYSFLTGDGVMVTVVVTTGEIVSVTDDVGGSYRWPSGEEPTWVTNDEAS